MGEEFFWETKRGVLSYVIARPLMTAVSVASNAAGAYCDGEFRSSCAYPYVAFVNNCSQVGGREGPGRVRRGSLWMHDVAGVQ